MKKSFNSALNFFLNKNETNEIKLNEFLLKVVVIGFSIGILYVVDTILYGFLTR